MLLHLDDSLSTIRFERISFLNTWFGPKTRKIIYKKWWSLTEFVKFLAKMMLMYKNLLRSTRKTTNEGGMGV